MGIRIAGKKIVAVFAFLAISAAVSSMKTVCAANPGVNPDVTSDEISGQWTGQAGTNKVILTIKPGGNHATWEYRGQRNCTLHAGDSGTDKDNRHIYVFTSSNGGFCDKLTNGALYLKKLGSDLSYSMTASDNKQLENGTLTRK